MRAILFISKHNLMDLGLESRISHMHTPFTIELGINGYKCELFI